MFTLGVDIGSTASKAVIVKNGKEIISKEIIHVGAGTSGPVRVTNDILNKSNLKLTEISNIVVTGYGRKNYIFSKNQISELSCHTKGVHYIFPDVHTIIDIGGQDAKVIKVNKDGKMSNFVMNDKCAAGTGRFLEVMAKILEVDINNFGEIGILSENPCEISSTCTVFAESEVISRLSNNTSIKDIIAGINKSVAVRVGTLAKRNGLENTVVMTGGVAQNTGVVKYMEKELKTSIKTSPIAQFTGALGAALYAWEELNIGGKNNER
ncbi:MAG: acyl-CoA dehydratase activase [Fusobacteriaceae bacterium]